MISRLMFSHNIDLNQKWDPDFLSFSPIFTPLKPWAEKFSCFRGEWPGLKDYQNLLSGLPQAILTENGKPLKIVKQDGKPGHFSDHYAPRIYLTGEIQTRTENWHDFFQFLTWLMFPKTKAVINSIHIPAAQSRLQQGIDLGRRSPVENMLSLFDEGGAVILSSDDSILDLIKNFQWKELFWQRREELESKLKFITFGHALYEKALSPYIGMTANCILFHVDDAVLKKSNLQQLAWIDENLSKVFKDGQSYKKPKDLNPFPVLGLPGWHQENGSESFYDNVNYFRPGRNKKAT